MSLKKLIISRLRASSMIRMPTPYCSAWLRKASNCAFRFARACSAWMTRGIGRQEMELFEKRRGLRIGLLQLLQAFVIAANPGKYA